MGRHSLVPWATQESLRSLEQWPPHEPSLLFIVLYTFFFFLSLSLFKKPFKRGKKKKKGNAKHCSSWNLVRMAGGPSPQTTSCSSQGEWNFMKRYLRFGIGLEEWEQIFGLSYLLPSLSEISHSICHRVVKKVLRVPRTSLGSRASCFKVWGARAGRVDCHSRGRATKMP